MSKSPADLLIVHAAEIVSSPSPGPRHGAEMDVLERIPDGALAVRDGRIVGVGPTAEIAGAFTAPATLSAAGAVVLPGFVDAHTHPVFHGTREGESDLRQRGVDYEEITRRGGGIFRSVRDLRAAPDTALEADVRRHLDGFLRAGTTTVEAKSGYGLTLADECRSLEILGRVAADHPVRVERTFLGAHQVPPEYADRRGDYVRHLAEEMIPAVVGRGLARWCDVFCDRGAFTVAEARAVLEAAREHGLGLRVHAEELGPTGGADLAAELGAATADHLVHVQDATLRAFRERGVMPVVLPGTSFSLGNRHAAPARRMIEADLALVVASDFNPGTCYLQSPLLLVALACHLLGLTVAEALTATTANAAASLGLAEECGALLPGLSADCVLVEGHDHRLLGYRLAEGPLRAVVARGRVFPGVAAA